MDTMVRNWDYACVLGYVDMVYLVLVIVLCLSGCTEINGIVANHVRYPYDINPNDEMRDTLRRIENWIRTSYL